MYEDKPSQYEKEILSYSKVIFTHIWMEKIFAELLRNVVKQPKNFYRGIMTRYLFLVVTGNNAVILKKIEG